MAGNEHCLTNALYQKIKETRDAKSEQSHQRDLLTFKTGGEHTCLSFDRKEKKYLPESSLHSKTNSRFQKPKKIGITQSSDKKYFQDVENNESKMNYETPWNSKGIFPDKDFNNPRVMAECSTGFSPNENKPKIRLGYKRLQDIVCNKDSTEIVTILSNSYFGFEELLKTNLKPDLLMLTIQVLAKACKSEFQTNKAFLLSTVCQTNYLEQIEQHMFKMPTDDSHTRRHRMGNFITDLLVFFEAIMKILPNTASEKFRKIFISMDMMMKGVENYQQVDLREQVKKFVILEKQLKIIIEERDRRIVKASTSHEPPPDDFREKGIYPTLEELFDKQPPFIRPNIIKGAYLNVEHYLDVQYRLLREDFMAPLRDGLKQLIEMTDNNSNIRVENMRMYKNVSFAKINIVSDQIGLIVHFNNNKKMNINWEHSKRFMYGSLLIFTNNNFKNIIFGSVLERSIKDLEEGIITVALHEEGHEENLYENEFLMVESEVYFEPYRLVMEALQATNQFTFPMERYIISVQKESSPPKYLLENLEYTYDLEGHEIDVLDKDSWPNEFTLKLDKSQLAAFKAALTEEFVVIQGPPGTGKTFLGLKIVKVLLKNSAVWNADTRKTTPILVVCFTNHALDQFLEGLLSETHDIVRVGGQSRSDRLSEYNLKEIRKRFDFTNRPSFLKREIHSRMETLLEKVTNTQACLEELEKELGVISVRYLKNEGVISVPHLQWLEYYGKDQDWMIREWLLDGIYDFHMNKGNNAKNITENADLSCLQDMNHVMHYSVNLQELVHRTMLLQKRIEHLQNSPMSFDLQETYKEEYDELCMEFQYFNMYLKQKYNKSSHYIRNLHSVPNLWQLATEDRWVLYQNWVQMLKDKLQKKMSKYQFNYLEYSKQHEELQYICDLEILQNKLVVGMTTTCAARLHHLLQILKPKIVIVEEAAEVLESHVIVSLTDKCEHLILIGDHQQLRPTTAVYKLARQYHFDISLFERMVKNGMHCHCLANQHRMRPEIAKLIVPAIYSHLENNKSVYNYPPVRGISKALFFITHDVPEEKDMDIMSHRNCHEANFLLGLCRHLLWQGYNADEITILTTYKGQMFYMQQKKKSMESLCDVKITVVDNYQGEENKIILLSLVRSNELSKIGFVGIENRVCVALSRAKEGFYIIGNMDNLVQSSKIWPQVRDTLLELQCFGTHLSLQCQIHPEQVTLVSCENDFTKVPEGGCSLPCVADLECGHQCKSICHVNNRSHKEYRCHEKCERIPKNCPLGHPCPKLCYEDCGECEVKVHRHLRCGHEKELPCHVDYEQYQCLEILEVQLPHCGHLVNKPCWSDIQTFPCTFPCLDRAPCGHSCIQFCHASRDPDHLQYKCEKQCVKTNDGCSMKHMCTKLCHEKCGLCNFEVKKRLPNCDHIRTLKCHEDPATVQCTRNCEKTLNCGHSCPKKCFEKCGDCKIMVEKTISTCGHQIQIQCHDTPQSSMCKSPCKRLLGCGHQCLKRCGEECATLCNAKTQCPIQTPCGHSIEILCYLQENIEENLEQVLELCQSPCGETLSCGHPCRGTCGECIQGRIHNSCTEQCGRTLICGHKCRVPCAMSCPPCSAKCIYECKHSRCSRKCGEPCVKCQELCDWKCEHLRCTKLCYELCDRNPCYKPCKKNLKCGHQCIGFCGEPCPPLCRICNEQQVKEIFFGTEEEDNARFVFLVDCKHTFESEGLEMWLEQCDNEVTIKTCPRCKSYIMLTQRFSKYMKIVSNDIALVKRKLFGNMSALEHERDHLLAILKEFISSRHGLDNYMKSKSKTYADMLNTSNTELSRTRKGRRVYLSKVEFQSLQGQIEIFKDLLDTVYISTLRRSLYLTTKIEKKVFFHFDQILQKVLDRNKRICSQEISDLNRECKRFLAFTELAVVQSSRNFSSKLLEEDIKTLYKKACSVVNSIEIYSDVKHEEVRKIIKMLHQNVGCTYLLEDRERREIVMAMGFKQGHWFKCPNGHIYCIGECGGAMEEGACPECGESIGGSRHRLLPSNTLASEMDGAVRHAYPSYLY